MRDLYSKAYIRLQVSNQDLLKEEEIEDEEATSDKISPPEPQIIHCDNKQSFLTNPQWRNYLELSDTSPNSSKKIKNEPATFSPLNALDFNKLQTSSIISKDDVNNEHTDLKIKPTPTIRADEKTTRNLHQFPFNSFQPQSPNFNRNNPSQYANLLANQRNIPQYTGLLMTDHNPNLFVVNQNYTSCPRQIGQGLENYYGVQNVPKQTKGIVNWEQQQFILNQSQQYGELESPIVVKREGTITKKEEDTGQK